MKLACYFVVSLCALVAAYEYRRVTGLYSLDVLGAAWENGLQNSLLQSQLSTLLFSATPTLAGVSIGKLLYDSLGAYFKRVFRGAVRSVVCSARVQIQGTAVTRRTRCGILLQRLGHFIRHGCPLHLRRIFRLLELDG